MPSPWKDGVHPLIGKYLQHLKQSGYAPKSILIAETILRKFALYLEAHGLYELRSVTKKHLKRYLLYLKTPYAPRRVKQLREATIRSRWKQIALFFKYLAREGFLLYDPAASIDTPIVREKCLKEPLTIAEVEALLSQPDLKNTIGLRDRAILEVFYSTGVRRGELLRLELFDVDLAEKTIRVRRTKGLKDRVIPLGDEAAHYLERYIYESRSALCKDPGEKTLFLGARGGPLDIQTTFELVKDNAILAGIQKRVSPHLLRHTCATHLLAGGADIFAIQEMLGHSKAETTQIYAQATVDNLEEIHHRCHPRGKLV